MHVQKLLVSVLYIVIQDQADNPLLDGVGKEEKSGNVLDIVWKIFKLVIDISNKVSTWENGPVMIHGKRVDVNQDDSDNFHKKSRMEDVICEFVKKI